MDYNSSNSTLASPTCSHALPLKIALLSMRLIIVMTFMLQVVTAVPFQKLTCLFFFHVSSVWVSSVWVSSVWVSSVWVSSVWVSSVWVSSVWVSSVWVSSVWVLILQKLGVI